MILDRHIGILIKIFQHQILISSFFLIKQERVMAKSAEYGTAFLYGTAP